jgi:hypothetical protein
MTSHESPNQDTGKKARGAARAGKIVSKLTGKERRARQTAALLSHVAKMERKEQYAEYDRSLKELTETVRDFENAELLGEEKGLRWQGSQAKGLKTTVEVGLITDPAFSSDYPKLLIRNKLESDDRPENGFDIRYSFDVFREQGGLEAPVSTLSNCRRNFRPNEAALNYSDAAHVLRLVMADPAACTPFDAEQMPY